MDFVWEDTGTKDIQSSDVDTVPDLNISFYRPDIPTTHPALAYSIPSGY